jgi:NAD-dependent deacetylase
MKTKINEVGRLLKNARRILMITGAGVSAESGIPTFRGAAAAFPDGRTEEGIPFERVLSASTLRRTPSLSWKYFFLLELSLRGKEPNIAHRVISALQKPGRFVCVATQNIDGLHQRAGSSFVVELHGNLRRIVCTGCECRRTFATFESLRLLPRCPKCRALLRPDAVLYEERIPEEALELLIREQHKGFDLVFSIGTTSLFHYVTEPIMIAARNGTPVVEINPDQTPISKLADFRFPEPASRIMQALFQVAV